MRSRTAKAFSEFYEAMRSDIYVFCRAMNYDPSPQHRQLLDAVQAALHKQGPSKIAVKSGQGPGKTKCSGIVGLYLLLHNPYTKLLLTAPTMRQCKDAWLGEVKQSLNAADPMVRRLFHLTGTGIGVLGRKPSEWGCLLLTATRSENLQGQHRKDMHLIVEEASGVPRELVEQFKGTLSNPNAIFIQIGNPNSRESQFFDCFNSQRHKWRNFTWSAEDTPASEWFDPQRNADLEEEYGRDSDVYRVRVLGEFPDTDPNCVMSSEDLEICGDRKLLIPSTRLSQVKSFGIDFARFGGDESAIYRRSGEAIVESFVKPNIDPNDLCDKAFDMQLKAHWRDQDCWFVADAGGLGQGVMGNFYRALKRLTEFHNGGSPTDRQYANKVTQAYFEMAKKVKQHAMYLPRDHVLIQQLSSRQYTTNIKGKLILETKDIYMKRHELSPDRADGMVLAMWDHRQANATIFRRMEESARRVGTI